MYMYVRTRDMELLNKWMKPCCCKQCLMDSEYYYLQDPAAAMTAGDQNWPSITSRTKHVIKTHSGNTTEKSPKLKSYQKARQIVDSQSWRAVTGTCLDDSKASFRFACAASRQ